jgi:hypothetical protein
MRLARLPLRRLLADVGLEARQNLALIAKAVARVLRESGFPRHEGPRHAPKPEFTMIRHRLSHLGRLFVPVAAMTLCLGVHVARAQNYPPPGGGGPYDAPRPITPPAVSGQYGSPGYGQPYAPPSPPQNAEAGAYYDAPASPPPGAYSSNEIMDTGHRFFGSISEGLAKVVQHAFSRNGYPTGYVLGEEAGGALVAGLRYGEGTLYTKNYPPLKVYWQGPSLGYDFGGNGAKVMTLIYNLQYTPQIFERFVGIDGSAYLVGGVGMTFLQRGDVVLAPIRAGVGLRLGANVGYLKYTPSATWNPF